VGADGLIAGMLVVAVLHLLEEVVGEETVGGLRGRLTDVASLTSLI